MERSLLAASEPKDKLDAMTGHAFAMAMAALGVNGPEDDDLDWNAIDWRKAEDDVRRLRRRIFTAAQAGDLRKVRSLQKLMLRSWSNTLVGVRRVTQRNAGRETAGIDGETALTPQARAELVMQTHRQTTPWQARPVKRVYIPKSNGKLRGLGIPVLRDRVLQARVTNALEPEWEARFEPRSYGFRPGRGCHDAIEAIYWTLKGTSSKRQWVLDADLAAAFDRIDHSRLLAQLGTFPGRGMIGQWLKAGVVEKGRFMPTEEGTPQGGVVSPLLLNIALHGMEQAAGVRYVKLGAHGAETKAGSPVVVRYADDLVALCHSRDQAEQVRDRLAEWLAPRGLAFNEGKTTIVRLSQGFDFLGFSVRRYRSGKLLIKPSKQAVTRHRKRLATELRSLRGANARAVTSRLNPIIRGWAAYYRGVVSKEVFSTLDHYLWKITYQWALAAHRNKSKRWVADRYFGNFHPTRQDRWVFGDRDSGYYLRRYVWTRIVRHRLVMGSASPDDPALAQYWADRRRRKPPPLGRLTLRLLTTQAGRCPICGDFLLHADHEPQSPHQWEQWIKSTQKALVKQAIRRVDNQTDSDTAQQLVHAHCARQHQTRQRDSAPRRFTPTGLA